MSSIDDKLKQARSFLEEGQAEAARLGLLEILMEDAANTTALLMLGGIYFYEKKYSEAEMVYERLIQAEPGSGMLSIALFNSLWKQGRHTDAAEEIRRFISVADKDVESETLKKYAEIINNMSGE